MSRQSNKSAAGQGGERAVDIDSVLTDNAARLNSILGRWRREDRDRPLQLPLAGRCERIERPALIPVAPSSPIQAEGQQRSDGDPTGGVSFSADEPTPGLPPISDPASVVSHAHDRPAAEVKAKDTGERQRKSDGTKSGTSLQDETTPDPLKAAAQTEPRAPLTRAPPSTGNGSRVRTNPAPVTSTIDTSIRQPASPETWRLSELYQALIASKRAIKAVGWYSCVINILMLTGPLFMLQVYDRVLASGSVPTLASLFGLTVALYGIIGIFELIRSRIITRIAVEIDQRIGDRIFEASLRNAVGTNASPASTLRELDTVRTFAAGPAPMTFFDSWWTPVYLIVIFLTHWSLGILAALGTAAVLYLAYLSDLRSRAGLIESQKAAAKSLEIAEAGQRNAESLSAMGMIGAYRTRWQTLNQEALGWQILASDRLGSLSSIAKVLRLLLQSAMLGLGAWLALKNEISPGAIIAATIILGRALAPVEQIVTHWRGFLKAYESYRQIDALLKAVPPRSGTSPLPAPAGHLRVEALHVAAPGSRQLILSNIRFEVRPGQMLAVIGPSASGKSTLARSIVGIWPAFAGTITLDGAPLRAWDSETLGRHVGYLPQDTELFAATVRDNIARFNADASDEEIIAAATAAHAHELIMSLPQGYDTELGMFGTRLSGGQRQRIALARALFRNPVLVVLDEPNANLDRAGDEALAAAIDGMRARGQAIVLISHRVQAIHKADALLYLERGVQKAFGPRGEVMKFLTETLSHQQAGEQRTTTSPRPQARPSTFEGDRRAPSQSTEQASPTSGTPSETSVTREVPTS